MKKFWASLVLSAITIAAPAWAATNPFMDVPLNHWAYDAIGQLSARGVLSGYPDGTYKGKQPTTRYEMASALARALAVIDMTKADKQDVEMLKKLVVEFKDELNALGVKVDQLDGRLAVMESRLGGWKIGVELRLDIEDWDNDDNDGDAYLSRSRLELHRWFGEGEGMYFYARIRDAENSSESSPLVFDKFYVEIPFFYDSKLFVGRIGPDFEYDYRFQIGGFTDISNESWLTDRTVDGIQWAKSFGLGTISFYAAHPGLPGRNADMTLNMWELFGIAQLQFTERFGFDIGAQGFFGDDSTVTAINYGGNNEADFKMDNIWTVFAGFRFDFHPDATLKGIYYYQDSDAEVDYRGFWEDLSTDSASAWKVVIDVKQDLLKFTSLWLEYAFLEQGFYLPYGNVALTLVDTSRWNSKDGGAGFLNNDTRIWRVGATRQWNDKWSSWLYAAGHTLDDGGISRSGLHVEDAKMTQWGLGVEYRYNANVSFALNYINVDWNGAANRNGYEDEHRLQFRTGVAF